MNPTTAYQQVRDLYHHCDHTLESISTRLILPANQAYLSILPEGKGGGNGKRGSMWELGLVRKMKKKVVLFF